MQALLDEALDHGHDDDCRICAMARVIALLSVNSDPEFLGAVGMVVGRLQTFGSVRLPEER